jgi:hypothetical protein
MTIIIFHGKKVAQLCATPPSTCSAAPMTNFRPFR